MTFLALQPLSVDLLPAAVALDQRCFCGLWTLDGYQRELESPNSELLVLVEKAEAEEQQEQREQREQREQEKLKTQNSKLKTQNSSSPPLLGLGCYWAILEEAHITVLAIDPAYQQQGLGQTMLCALMASAHERGLERATLEVRTSNEAALSLYKKFGFREAGRRRRYYADTGEDALVLWRGGLQAPDFSDQINCWQQQVCDRVQRSHWECFSNSDRTIVTRLRKLA